ncbi:MAG: glycosyltransferase family 4 protein [Epulopiscium sp.]|nr:glycosyltransferase family 4 protein [Candidatus Epulonipiscium sp.]
MKILILCDHYPISPRVKKIRNSLIKLYPTSIVKIYAWNRSHRSIVEEYVSSFDQDIGYGNKLNKLLNLYKFFKSAKKVVNEFKPQYIHAIDIEMLIVSMLMYSRCKLIYEVYDIKFLKNRFLNYIREKIEFFIIKKYAYAVILASPYFNIYYKRNEFQGVKIITINNKPSKLLHTQTKNNYMNKYKDLIINKIVIGFIGTIRYQNILINLIDACKDLDNVIVLLSGSGPSFKHIEAYVKSNSLESKVIMTGRFNSEDLNCIYEFCDYIWAAYPNKDLNVRYAISNKFFESIVFRKKIIVSESTMIGEYVSKNNIGLTVDPYNVEKIKLILKQLGKYNYERVKHYIGEGLYWEEEEKELFNIYNDIEKKYTR